MSFSVRLTVRGGRQATNVTSRAKKKVRGALVKL